MYKPAFTLCKKMTYTLKLIYAVFEINPKKQKWIMYKQYNTPYKMNNFHKFSYDLVYHTATILTDFILEGWLNPHTDIKMSNIHCGHVKIHYDEIQRRWYVVILLTNHCPYKTSFFHWCYAHIHTLMHLYWIHLLID